MNDNHIEDLLRDARPVVKDDPAFLMETRRRMEQVEGIKAEVDRQHKRSRRILVITLVSGLVLGMLAMALVFLYPSVTQELEKTVLSQVRDFLFEWKEYLAFLVAALAVTLGLVLVSGRRDSIFTK